LIAKTLGAEDALGEAEVLSHRVGWDWRGATIPPLRSSCRGRTNCSGRDDTFLSVAWLIAETLGAEEGLGEAEVLSHRVGRGWGGATIPPLRSSCKGRTNCSGRDDRRLLVVCGVPQGDACRL